MHFKSVLLPLSVSRESQICDAPVLFVDVVDKYLCCSGKTRLLNEQYYLRRQTQLETCYLLFFYVTLG